MYICTFTHLNKTVGRNMYHNDSVSDSVFDKMTASEKRFFKKSYGSPDYFNNTPSDNGDTSWGGDFGRGYSDDSSPGSNDSSFDFGGGDFGGSGASGDY